MIESIKSAAEAATIYEFTDCAYEGARGEHGGAVEYGRRGIGLILCDQHLDHYRKHPPQRARRATARERRVAAVLGGYMNGDE